MRNTKRGSWYIEALTTVFAEDSRDTHVADMLVKVSCHAFPFTHWFLKSLQFQVARINRLFKQIRSKIITSFLV